MQIRMINFFYSKTIIFTKIIYKRVLNDHIDDRTQEISWKGDYLTPLHPKGGGTKELSSMCHFDSRISVRIFNI